MNNENKIKKLNMKLLIVLIVLVLSALLSISVFAAEVKYTSSKVTEIVASSPAAGSNGGEWDYNDLAGNWWLFCCQHGGELHSNGTKELVVETGDETTTITCSTDGGTGTITETEVSSEKGTSAEATNQDSVFWYNYTSQGTTPTDAMESYILAYAQTYGSGYRSAAQLAWWGTRLGSEGASGGSGFLYDQALAFETYVKKIMGSAYDNGMTASYNGYECYDLDSYYNPTIRYYLQGEDSKSETTRKDVNHKNGVTEDDRLNVTFEQESNAYIVGPFSLDYVESSTNTTTSTSDLNAMLTKINDLENCINNMNSEINRAIRLVNNYNGDSSKTNKESADDAINEVLSDTKTILDALGSEQYKDINETRKTLKKQLKNESYDKISSTLKELQGYFKDESENMVGENGQINSYREQVNEQIKMADSNGTVTYDDAFSRISGAYLSTNLGEAEFNSSTGVGTSSNGEFTWTFRYEYSDNNRLAGDTYVYPHNEEVFYLVINYTGKSNELLTSVNSLKFDFQYMNAGGYFEKFTGTKYYSTGVSDSTEVTKYYYDYYDYVTDENGNKKTDDYGNYITSGGSSTSTSEPSGHDYVKVTAYDVKHNITATMGTSSSQTLGKIASGGAAIWWNQKSVELSFESGLKWGELDIEKKSDNPVDKQTDFIFDVYIDYDGGTNYEYLTATTVTLEAGENYGKANVGTFYWYGDTVPSYKIEEREKEGWTAKNGPWKGNLNIGEKVVVTAENIQEEHKGKVEIVKTIQNDSLNLLSDKTYSFTVGISGTFKYNGEMQTKSVANPLEIDVNIDLKKTNTWESDDIYWYGDDAPTCTIIENIPDGAIYKCTKFQQSANLEEGETISFTFVNELNVEATNIKINKQMTSGKNPENSATFDVSVKLIPYSYVDSETGESIKESFWVEQSDGSYMECTDEYDFGDSNNSDVTDVPPVITLKSENNWEWVSDTIYWVDNAPTVEIEEIGINNSNSKFLSITDKLTTKTISVGEENKTTEDENDEDKTAGNKVFIEQLTPVNNSVEIIITNDDSYKQGNISIYKEYEDEEQVFLFDVEIYDGIFTYEGKSYDKEDTLILENCKVSKESPWISETFTWFEEDGAPSYTITEINDEEFLSASSTESGRITDTPTVTGKLDEHEMQDGEYSVIVNYINGINSELTLTKEIIGRQNLPAGYYEFGFEVTIQGDAFNYDGQDYTSDNPLTLNPWIIVRVDDDGGLSVWHKDSEEGDEYEGAWTLTGLTWNASTAATPQFKIEETSMPDGFKFVQFRIDNNKVTTIESGWYTCGGNVSLNAINEYTDNPRYGKLAIEKKAVNDEAKVVEGQEFNFIAEVQGKFAYTTEDGETIYVNGKLVFENGHSVEENVSKEITYNGKEYTVYSEYYLEGINVKAADGEQWISGTFEWNETEGTPTYQVTENITEDQENDGVEFGRIYSNSNAKTSNGDTWVAGDLVGSSEFSEDENYPKVIVTAENGSEQKYGRLKVTKRLYIGGNETDDTGVLTGVSNDNQTFTIRIQIYTDSSKANKLADYTVSLAGGQTHISDYYYWSGNDAPYYEITEEDADNYAVTITNNGEGYLLNEDTVEVTVVNELDLDHTGNIIIKKEVLSEDKVSVEDANNISGVEFEIEVTVTMNGDGVFMYSGDEDNNIYSKDKPLKLSKKLQAGDVWEINGISWSGDTAPEFAVSETSIPANYTLDHMEDGIDNEYTHGSSWSLNNNGTVGETVVNLYSPDTLIYLTMEIGGKVWDDTGSYDKVAEADGGSGENGLFDEGEPGISGVKVTVSRGIIKNSDGTLVKKLDGVYGYDNNYNVIIDKYEDWYVDSNGDLYTYTDSDGNWNMPRIAVPQLVGSESYDLEKNNARVAYYVTFTYDGQTYEPTTFMVSTQAKADDSCPKPEGTSSYSELQKIANHYDGLSISIKDNYLQSSMAVDDESARNTFNAKFSSIEGGEDDEKAIDENGYTTGKAVNGNTTTTLKYSSTESISGSNSDNTKRVSTLLTDGSSYGESEKIYSGVQMDASTLTGYLAFPSDNDINLNYFTINKQWVDDDGTINRTYHGVYNYMDNINLGLIKREAADLAVQKDLSEMIVTINGKAITYKYNSLVDFNKEENWDYLLTQLEMEDQNVTYTLGLYAGDYYYRAASIYDTDDTLVDVMKKSITQGKDLSILDLDVYLRYTMTVYNESETYDVKVNSINDYHDDTLVLVDPTDINATGAYIKEDGDGIEINTIQSLAEYAGDNTITAKDAESVPSLISWTSDGDIDGSDGVTYVKETTDSLKGCTIHAGGSVSFETTYKVNTDKVEQDGVALQDAIVLGEKHNIIEIGSFTDYYSGTSKNKWGNTEGTVAGRVDEDSAPDNINIGSLNETSYYEDDTMQAPMAYVTVVDSDADREINGIVWEDAQTDEIAYSQVIGNGIYNLDEGDKLIQGLTTELVEVISVPIGEKDGNTIYEEYDFIWPTDSKLSELGISNSSDKTLADLTGFNSSTTTDEMGSYEFIGVPAGNYKVRFVYGDKEVYTGNDDEEVVYNGQDYKSTAYQVGFDNDSDGDGYTDNAWHDLSSLELAAARVSDARDVEARRLYITSKSEMQTYDNTSVLATADDVTADHDELFGTYDHDNPVAGEGYYMYAETAKIKLDIENTNELEDVSESKDGITVVYGTEVKGHTTVANYKYTVDNIDFGLEERSQTKLKLDKQVKEITLTTPDGEAILDAVYDIIYDMNSDDTIDVTVKLNENESTGYSNIASLNRSGNSQGYRYIMIDSTILQGSTITVNYQFTVFNIGEADTSSTRLTKIWENENSYDELEIALTELTSPYNTKEYRLTQNEDGTVGNYKYQYGTYFGSIYYLGTEGTYFIGKVEDEDGNITESVDRVYDGEYYTSLAKTTVHNIIDYVDPDVEFIDTDNMAVDQSWSTTTIMYLVENNLIDPDNVILINDDGLPELIDESDVSKGVKTWATNGGDLDAHWSILNDSLQEYSTDTKNNIALSVDNADGDSVTNPGLVKETVPYTAFYNYTNNEYFGTNEGNEVILPTENVDEYTADTAIDYAYDRATAQIMLQVSRYYSSEDDEQSIDNIAELIKIENTVGRRSSKNTAGNTITYQIDLDNIAGYDDPGDIVTTTVSLYTIAGQENDTDATEMITLTPPTGVSSNVMMAIQIAAIVLVTAVVVAVGIVFIKKEVLM